MDGDALVARHVWLGGGWAARNWAIMSVVVRMDVSVIKLPSSSSPAPHSEALTCEPKLDSSVRCVPRG